MTNIKHLYFKNSFKKRLVKLNSTEHNCILALNDYVGVNCNCRKDVKKVIPIDLYRKTVTSKTNAIRALNG
jgi:hypothetical protein